MGPGCRSTRIESNDESRSRLSGNAIPSGVDTRLLRTFLVLARTGSFTATAAELHVVQSTVTGHVHALERRVGARLFDRLPGGARLTEAGRRVVGPARDLLDVQQRLLDAAGGGTDPAGE